MNLAVVFGLGIGVPALVMLVVLVEQLRGSASSRSSSRSSSSSGRRLRGRHGVRNERARALREQAEREAERER